MASSQPTVNASGIAKMAGVGRAAVSNWRRRHADFPQPVGGTAASPVFDASAVVRWLSGQGKLHSDSTLERVWRHIDSITPATAIGQVLCAIGAWLLVGSARLPAPRRLLSQLRAENKSLADLAELVLPEQWPPEFVAVLGEAAKLRQEHEPGEAFEYLHAQYVGSTRALSGPDATPEPVAEIMLDLAGTGRRVFDFTSGTGSLLVAAAQRGLEADSVVHCSAQEIKPHYALITLLRLWLRHQHAVTAGLAVQAPVVAVGDSLLDDRFPRLSADVVVANPPFGIHDWGHEKLAYDPRWAYGLPPRTEPELAWVQHALAHLAPGGTAVLLMPPAAAARPAGRRIRGELVRHGALRAVIALPAGMMLPAAIGLHLWVLRRPQPGTPATPRVLFVDSAAAVSSPGTPVSTAGTAAISELIGRAWRSHLADPDDPVHEPGAYHAVSAVDILDEQVDLNPRRYLPPPREQVRDPQQVLAAATQFAARLDEIGSGLPRLRRAGIDAAVPEMAIADLIKSGGLVVHRSAGKGRGEGGTGSGSEGGTGGPHTQPAILTDADVIGGLAPSGRGEGGADLASAVRVRAGDVLVPVAAHTVTARVATDEQVGAVLGPGVYAVRVSPELIDPWFLAGVLSKTDNARIAGRSSSAGNGMLRIDVRRLTVPVLPIETQREYGAVFQQLAQFQTALAGAARHGGQLARSLADGLATGVFAPAGD